MKKKKGGRATAPKPKGQIRLAGDPILAQTALNALAYDDHGDPYAHIGHLTVPQMAEMINGMHRIMERDHAVGLAAPQIGQRLRVLTYNTGRRRGREQVGELIDPFLQEYSTERSWFRESCLSIPGLVLEIERPTEVVVGGFDLNLQPVRIEADGLLARVLQHEIDHLYGELMIEADLGPEQRAAAEAYIIKTNLALVPRDVHVLIDRDGVVRSAR